jgi:hypothetical protein
MTAITTGFLADTSIISVTLPTGYAVRREACSTVLLPGGGGRVVQWADRASGDAMAAGAGLQTQGQHATAAAMVTEYRQNDPFTGDYFTTVLRFQPETDTGAFGWMWLTLDPQFDASDTRDLVISAITPLMDRAGLPRFRISAPLRAGSPLDPGQRDMIAFFAAPVAGSLPAVRLWNTGALSSDGPPVAGNSWTAGTPGGVSVQCDALSAKGAQSDALQVASSLQRR